MDRTARRFLVAAAAALAAACSPPPLSEGPGGSTPQECFAKVKAAQEKFEWRSLPDHYVPESMGNLLGAAVVPWAEIRRQARKAGKPEPEDVHFVEGILREKGVSLDAVVKALDSSPDSVGRLFESVIDRKGLFAAVMNQTSGGAGYRRPRLIAVEGVTVDGETARGTMKVVLGEGEPSGQPIRFRQMGGRWFIVLGEAP